MPSLDDAHLRINGSCRIASSELVWRFTGSGGPGGQHANTANTKVELTFDIAHSPSLGAHHRERLLAALGPQVRVHASDTRSQTRNRELALERLVDRLIGALRVDAPRRPTTASKASKRARVDVKRKRSGVKQQRRRPTIDD